MLNDPSADADETGMQHKLQRIDRQTSGKIEFLAEQRLSAKVHGLSSVFVHRADHRMISCRNCTMPVAGMSSLYELYM